MLCLTVRIIRENSTFIPNDNYVFLCIHCRRSAKNSILRCIWSLLKFLVTIFTFFLPKFFINLPNNCSPIFCPPPPPNWLCQPDVSSPSFRTPDTVVRRVMSELYTQKWTLHHNNAPLYTAFSFKEILAIKSIVVLKHIACSPELCDSFLFPTMKNHQKWSHSETVVEIQKFRMAVPNNVQQNNFWECFWGWKWRWNSPTAVGGNCSEGGHCSSA
jgi:hypothetical protein